MEWKGDGSKLTSQYNPFANPALTHFPGTVGGHIRGYEWRGLCIMDSLRLLNYNLSCCVFGPGETQVERDWDLARKRQHAITHSQVHAWATVSPRLGSPTGADKRSKWESCKRRPPMNRRAIMQASAFADVRLNSKRLLVGLPTRNDGRRLRSRPAEVVASSTTVQDE